MRKTLLLFLSFGVLGGLLYCPTELPLIARANTEKIEEKAIEQILEKCAEYCNNT